VRFSGIDWLPAGIDRIRPAHRIEWKANRVIFHQISDWSDAYANAPNIPGGERWPAAWVQPAQAYRDALQGSGRATLDYQLWRARTKPLRSLCTGRPAKGPGRLRPWRILEGARQELLVASRARIG
jgi:hypothetical protein